VRRLMMCLSRRGTGTNDPSSCVHFKLLGSPVVVSAAPAPHSDVSGPDALNGAPVECAHNGWGSSRLLEFAKEVEAPLCFLHQQCSVGGLGEVLTDVHPQEFGAAHFFPGSTKW
jgi:hypothetical protein